MEKESLGKEEIIALIKKTIQSGSETVFLDFKQSWYKKEKRYDFIKDMLCLCNCDYNGNRYLVFGIKEENSGNFSTKGIGDDKNRKKTSDLIDLIKKNYFNKIPNIVSKTVKYEEYTIDYIEIIKDTNHIRPYYLEKTSSTTEKHLSCGTIYSRNGDSNTPSDSVASKYEIEKMWIEHFGLDKSPLERFKIYLKDKDNFIPSPDYSRDDNNVIFFHKKFPEFQILERKESYSGTCRLDWRSSMFPRQNCEMSSISLQYYSTILYQAKSIHIDNWHTWLMHPMDNCTFHKNDKYYQLFYFVKNSLEHKLSLLLLDQLMNRGAIFCENFSDFDIERIIFLIDEDQKSQQLEKIKKKFQENDDKDEFLEVCSVSNNRTREDALL